MDGVGTIGDPRLWLLYHYWRGKKGGRAMPSPLDIDLLTLPKPVQPNTMLLNVVDENGTLRFRYSRVGAVFWRASGKEPVGQYVDEALSEVAGYRKYVVGIYQEMAATKRPMYTENLFILQHGESDPMATKRVSLPLSRDGETVHEILAAHVFDYGGGSADAFSLVTSLDERVRSFLE
jgi:hypothetical protein